jgi:hypothetical protein
MRRHYASDDALLPVTEVMRRLDLKSASGARRWLKRARVRMVRPGRKYLVRQSEFDAALERRTAGDLVNRATEHLRGVA